MRILFSSTRGAGHFTPLVPYIEACRKAGHDVAVAAPEDIRAAVARTGAAFLPFDHPGDAQLRPIWARLPGASVEEANAIVVREIFAGIDAEVSLPRLERTFLEFRPDVVVRECSEFGAAVIAEKHGVPQARVATGLASVEDRSLEIAGEAVDALRRRVGLDPVGVERLRESLYLTVVPPSFEDPAAPSQPHTKRFREPRVGAPAGPLPAWWSDADEPLVYITFGSVAGSMPTARAAYRAAAEAVADLPVRALLTTGAGVEPDALGVLPERVHVEAWVPHYQVLEHAALVVCHGGSGTVLGTLAAGRPLVVVPLFADQPHNAARVAATSAGFVVEPDAASPSVLRDAIGRALSDATLRRGAAALAAEMAAQLPIEAAVDAIARAGR